jgi:ferredoxin
MYQIIIRDGCIGCSVCWMLDSLHFMSNAMGQAQVTPSEQGTVSGTFDDDHFTTVRVVSAACPVSIIRVQVDRK